MQQSFGFLIKKTRKEKGYSQRVLANLLGLDFTYLSKLENDRADYPPKEEVIRSLAVHLNLDAEELIFLAGRVPQKDGDFLRRYYKSMPILFKKMRENPKFAEDIFKLASQAKS
jgi:HTH-type transcriptional regulator, competence development regulator